MDRQITEQIVDNALLNDKEGFMSAFQAAMATKVADALEVKKVEVSSNMLGAAEVAAQEDTLEEEVEQIDEISKDLVDKYRNKAWNWVSKAVDAPGRYWDGRKTVAAQQAYLNKAAKNVIKAGKRLKSMELADKKFSARSNATHVVPATSKYTKEEAEQVDEAKMTDAHKKIARQVHRDLKSDESVSQAYGFRVRQMHNLIRKKYGSNWRALAGINEEVEQIDEGYDYEHRIGLVVTHPKLQPKKRVTKFVKVKSNSDDPIEVSDIAAKRMKDKGYKVHDRWHSSVDYLEEEVEQIDEMEKDVSGPGRDGDGAHFTGSKDKKPVIKMTGKERKTSDALARALKRLAAKKLPK